MAYRSRQHYVQVTDWNEGGVDPSGSWLGHERQPTKRLLVDVTNTNDERQAVFPEGMETERKFLTGFRDRDQITNKFGVEALSFKYL